MSKEQKEKIRQCNSLSEIRNYIHSQLILPLEPMERNKLAGVFALTTLMPNVIEIKNHIDEIFDSKLCDVIKIAQNYKESKL